MSKTSTHKRTKTTADLLAGVSLAGKRLRKLRNATIFFGPVVLAGWALFSNAPDHVTPPPPQDTASTTQSFDDAVQSPTTTQNTNDAYQISQSIIQDRYPNSVYNPFIVTRIEDKPEYRERITTITHTALMYSNLNPVWFTNQMYRECQQFNPEVINGNKLSSAGAVGCAQFMPATAAEIGFTVEDMSDFDTAMNVSAYHMSQLTTQYEGDQILAMVAYNGGDGAVNFVQEELGLDNITGQDWLTFMDDRRYNLPSNKSGAWQNETYNYVITIIHGEEERHHQRLAKQQQLGGLPPNLMFIGAILANKEELITEANFLSLQEPMAGQYGPEVEVPIRPLRRPKGLASQMADAISPEETITRPLPRPTKNWPPVTLTASLDNNN